MMLVVAVVLAGVLQSICVLVGLSWLIRREKRALSARMAAIAEEWLVAPEGQKHKLGQALDAAGADIGSAVARSIMASIGAERSHVTRVANGMLDEAQGNANPVLGLLAGGKRGKAAGIMQLAELVGSVLRERSSGDNGAAPVRRHRE